MTLLRQKKIALMNKCGAIYDELDLTKAILWYSNNPVQSVKHVYLHAKYPCVSIGREKIHIHRLLMMFWMKANIPDGYFVHHNDSNKLNALKNNLSILYSSYHQMIHNKGKVIPKSQRDAIIKQNHSRRGKRAKVKRPDVTPKMVYEMRKTMSFNEISIRTNLDWCCVRQRYRDFIHDNPELLKGGKE